MSSIINVLEKPLSDENIIKKDYHTYIPYLQSYNNNDEIRISIQNQDLYVLPGESYLYVEGFVADEKTLKPTSNFKLRNNFVAYLFDEIRYELNGTEIDHTRYLGATSTIKNFVSLSPTESIVMKNAGWNKIYDVNLENGYFNFYVPLKMLLGFAEDYNKIILNSKHELILLRNKNDEGLVLSDNSTEKAKLVVSLISWRIPHVQLSDLSKLNMIKILNNGASIPIAFRSWDCHINPQLSTGNSHIWNVKLAANRERPRFVLIAFQRDNKFVHCNLTNLKVHLNSVSYPYDDLNLKFEHERYAVLYDMYLRFQQCYYMKEPQPLLTAQEFKNNAPIIVVDVSHQNESLNTGPIDIKLEFETATNIPAKTAAYCILMHDRIIEYIPIRGQVRKVL
ncbi:hypothetical protein EVAR_67679_1 [Eumeta japonica]|uniref:Double jelly roll-like domain-containing protein n=1 Tax=Eumeta variegata TaxID=151549 RepID=A0A4C1SNE9_EUMVA|nr:hypothetical protein EVAR_67679_1 [Eumeta japonica]